MIDSSVALYGQVFPRVAYKHRLQMLEHFTECIKSAKSSRQQAVQINIFTAVLCSLKVEHVAQFFIQWAFQIHQDSSICQAHEMLLQMPK